MKNIFTRIGNILFLVMTILMVIVISYLLGYHTAESEQKEVMIKHLISPFHNAEHVWQDLNQVNYQVVPSDMVCTYPRDTTHTPVDTTEH